MSFPSRTGRAAPFRRTALRCLQHATLAAALLGLAAPALSAAEKHVADGAHRGVVPLGGYEVFPENREGNGIYLERRLLFTLPNQAIVDILPLDAPGRFAYLARSGDQYTLGVRLAQEEPPPRIRTYGEHIYHAVMVIQGVVYKKVYRVLDGKIQDLLRPYRTADGLVLNDQQLAFYHVASVQRNEGSPPSYGIRLHLVTLPRGKVLDLPGLVFNGQPSLKMVWEGSDLLQYTLEDGRVESVLSAQFE